MIVYPKINLGLNVLRRRDDGYHDIETLFVHCDAFNDELLIEEASETVIRIESSSRMARVDWDPHKDLTMKAYRMLSEDFDLPPVSILLRKGIPVGAGLGGGSADATAALLSLNSLFGLGLDAEGLHPYASRLGSDCPFFLCGENCIGEGRGDILTPYPLDLDGYEIVVRTPEVKVSTAEAYRGIRLHTGPSLREALSHPVSEWKDVLSNDFENTVFPLYPSIRELKESFYADGAVYASMSGSGSSVFGLFRTPSLG